MTPVSSFTFGSYRVDTPRSVITFTYRVAFENGKIKSFTDTLQLPHTTAEMWGNIPKSVLEPTLQALLLVLGINYWVIFPTKHIRIEGFTLTKEQAQFWEALYLNGLGEFFYLMKMDFRDLIVFPYDASKEVVAPASFARPARTLLLNGAGKDSILSAELLKASSTPFDFFAFAPTRAHERVAKLVGAKTVRVTRRRDPRASLAALIRGTSSAYPSVSTFTFVATLLAELFGYDSIAFSNERSADFGNLTYLGLPINHQWCKSSEAERLINDYIHRYLTSDIKTHSLLREYNELEIVQRFVRYPQYLQDVTSCNTYFWLSPFEQFFARRPYWCGECPKCVFLFACFAAFLPKKEVVRMFGKNLYAKKHLVPLIRQILGVEGHKPLDCVGEPEEMILAMQYATRTNEYANTPAILAFEASFPPTYDFKSIEKRILSATK